MADIRGSSQQVHGTIAHDTADGDNPIKVGGKARNANPTAVANDDVVDSFHDLVGRQVVNPYVPRDLVAANTITLTTTTETTLIAAGGASVFHDLIWISVSNGSSGQLRIDFRDDTAGTVRFSMYLAADGGGFTHTFPAPFPATAVNDNWTAQLSGAPASNDVRITAQAIKNV